MKEKVHCGTWDGVLYPVKGRKDKIMITMSGSEGGLEHAGKMAHFLQDNGIPALALGYFKTRHTARHLDRLPLEIRQSAIAYLTDAGYGKIGICGASKGAEYALAAAIAYPALPCVIVKTPSWFYSEGMRNGKPSGTSCWSYQGGELPFTPYKTIPVEKIHAPILILSLEKDTVWPSKESGEKLVQRLQEHGFAYPYKHICYEHMGHMMLEYCGSEIKYFIKSERQYPEACTKERQEMGRACVDWIENRWE